MHSEKLIWGAVALVVMTGGNIMTNAAQHPWAQQKTYVSNAQMTSKRTSHDFAVDAELQKPVWRDAPWVTMDHDAFHPVTFPQAATQVASVWTPSYVYFAFRCKYTVLNIFDSKDTSKDFWTLWDRDVVEVFLNPQPGRMRHYYEFEVAPNNLWIDLEIDLARKPFNNAKWNSGFEHATHVDPRNHIWTCEMRIPVVSMGTKPLAVNTEWRLNIFRADGQGDDQHRRFLSWSLVHNDNDSFHAPWSFGVIRFVK